MRLRHLIVIALLLMPLRLFAATGDLVKIAGNTAVYYLGSDGKRYVFPTSSTYFSWYGDFSSVRTIPAEEMAAITIGGNVTYRPGTRMVKIATDPKVYAVDKGGVLRHVTSEAIAYCLYSSNWNKVIDDVPDAFFVNYTVGAPLESCTTFDPAQARVATPTIGVDKGLDGVGTTMVIPSKPTFTTPLTDRSAAPGQVATLMEITLATPKDAEIKKLPIRLDALTGVPAAGNTDADLGGLVRGSGERPNLKDVKIVDAAGQAVFGTLALSLATTADQSQLLEFGGSYKVSANTVTTLRVLATFDTDVPSGEEYRASVPVAKIQLADAQGLPLSFNPTTDLVGGKVTTGTPSLEASVLSLTSPTTHVRGEKNAVLASFSLHSGTAVSSTVRSIAFQGYIDEQEGHVGFLSGSDADNGTETRVSDDIAGIRLVDANGVTIGSTRSVPTTGRIEFTDLNLTLPAGASVTVRLVGDVNRDAVIEEQPDLIAFDIPDVANDILAVDGAGVKVQAKGTYPNGGVTPSQVVTILKTGGLTLSWNGAIATGVAGREVSLGKLSVAATDDAYVIKTLTVTSVGASHSSTGQVRLSYVDAGGISRSADGTWFGQDVTFSNLSMRAARGATATAEVLARLDHDISVSTSGQRLQFRFASDRTLQFSSESEARDYTQADLTTNHSFKVGTDVTSDVTVRLTEVSAARDSASPSGSLARNASVPVLRFTLKAAPEGAARIKKLTFKLKSSDVGISGPGNDSLERWSDVNGDFSDDNGVIDLRKFSSSGSEIIGEGSDASIRYSILRGGTRDTTPSGLESVYGDQGIIEVEFADGSEISIPAGTTATFELSLKTDSFAGGARTLETQLLGAGDFLWTDVPGGYYVALDGGGVVGLPVTTATLNIP